MAAPTPTARQTPTGLMLVRGYQSLITFALDPNIDFWEKTVQPAGMDSGDEIDITTMHNLIFRTAAPRKLVKSTPAKTKVAYDPIAYDQILQIIGKETTVTVKFSDGSTYAAFGYLKSFVPDDMAEEPSDKQPTAEVAIVFTNYDPVGHVEAAPVMTLVVGT